MMDQGLVGFGGFSSNFIDDILVFSKDMASHRAALKAIFARPCRHKLTLRGKSAKWEGNLTHI